MSPTKRKRKSKEVAETDDAFIANDTHSVEPETHEPESRDQQTTNFNTQDDLQEEFISDIEDEKNIELENEIQEMLASEIKALTMPEIIRETNPIETETKFLRKSSKRDEKLTAQPESRIKKSSSKDTGRDAKDIASETKMGTPFTFKIEERIIPKAYNSKETAHIESQIRFPKESPINEGPVAPPRPGIHGVHLPQSQGSPNSPSTSFARFIPPIQELERPAYFQGPLLQQNNHIVMNQIRLPSMPDPRQQGSGGFGQSGDQGFAASQVPGPQGAIGSGFQPMPMYSHPGTMPGPSGPGFIQGQIPPHLNSHPGPYRTQSFQMLGSPLRHQGPQNQQLYPPYQPIYYVTQNFYGNVPGEMTQHHHNPGYFQAPAQAPQTNSTASGAGTATGITPPIGNPLTGDRPAQIIGENNVKPLQPTPLMSLSLEKSELNKDQNRTTRRSARRERAPRFQRFKDTTDSKMGTDVSDQVYDHYHNPITPMPEEWSAEMITEFSDRMKNLMTNDSESDSTTNDKHEPLVVDKTEHEQKNEQPDHADYKKQSDDITDAETALLAQKIEEYIKDSGQQTSSEERLRNMTDYMESSCTQSETNSVETTDVYLLPRVLKERIREVLNNLRSPNFDLLVDEVSKLKIESIKRLNSIANLILIKAINEPKFGEKCALVCKKLSKMRVCSDANSNKQRKKAILEESDDIPLGKLIIIRCETELKKCNARNERKIQKIEACEDPGERKLLQELTKMEKKRRVKCLGNIRCEKHN